MRHRYARHRAAAWLGGGIVPLQTSQNLRKTAHLVASGAKTLPVHAAAHKVTAKAKGRI